MKVIRRKCSIVISYLHSIFLTVSLISLFPVTIFSMNEKNIALAIDDLINNLIILKDKIGNDPQTLQTFLGELKDFKESNY